MIWKKKTLGDLCHIEKGKIGIQKATPGEFPLVVTAEERLSHNEYHFEGNAVIIPLVSSTGHGHKSLKRIHFQSGKFAVGNILCVVIPKDENVLRADYLYRFLDLNREKELVSRMKGMANVTLPMKEIAKVEIPIPPIEAQIEFVQQYAVLEEKSNDLDEEITHQLDLVKQLRQAFLREAMQGHLVPQDPNDEPASVLLEKIKAEKMNRHGVSTRAKKEKPLPPITEEEIPFEIPENWVWCRLGEITYTVSTGPFGTMLHKSDYVKEGIPLVNPMNIVDEKIVPSQKMMVDSKTHERLKSYVLKKGDVVIGRRGEMGRCAAVTEKEDGWLCGTGSFFIDLYSEIYRPYFVKALSSETSKKYLLGSSVGSTMNNLNHRILNSLPIPLPPLSEQQRIVAKLDELMTHCDELEASIKESQQQNELLLQQVLRETLEPKEKEAERV